VQKQLHLQVRSANKNKEFAFTRMLTCGACGSGVTAQEKYKNLKDGTINKYIYYRCTRFYNKNCPNVYLREESLVDQLSEIVDRIDINNVGIKSKPEKEIERFGEFKSKVLGTTEQEKIIQTKLDVRNYMNYLLREGMIQEKRDLMQSFTSKLILINKRVVLE
jgi:hypothetical protein